MKYALEPTDKTIGALAKEMEKHWPILSLFLCKQEHVYYYPSGKGIE